MKKDFNFYLKWSATAVLLLFTVMTAMNITPWNIYVANISSLMWLVWSYRIREWSLVVVNVVMLAVYLFGLIRSML